jgi:phosphohistidine phosphatase
LDLILWRHADAANTEPDQERRLTSKGRKQAAQMAKWLERHLPDSVKVMASPATRAQETAEALDRKFATVASLAPGCSPAHVLAAADWPDNRHTVLIVGHQPELGRVASMLLFGEERELTIRKGAAWWISTRLRGDETQPVLRCAVCPDLL